MINFTEENNERNIPLEVELYDGSKQIIDLSKEKRRICSPKLYEKRPTLIQLFESAVKKEDFVLNVEALPLTKY
ncbi:MAG: hypothetical protein MJ252_25285 [archaeon]|nr:hypothetical protein [archaeon]